MPDIYSHAQCIVDAIIILFQYLALLYGHVLYSALKILQNTTNLSRYPMVMKI